MDTISPQTSSEISEWVSAAALRLEAKVIAWRRDIHQHPELSYHETRTAALAARHLSALGLRGHDRGRRDRRGRRSQGRQARPGRGAARRHGCAAGRGAGRPALRLQGQGHVAWPDDRRHACLRPRRPCRHPDGRGRDPGGISRRAHRHGEAPVPAQRGRLRGPAERRPGDDRPRARWRTPRRRPSSGCTSPRRRPRASSPCGPAG